MGLLLAHNCTVAIYRDMVKVYHNGNKPPVGGGERKEIEGFTRHARKRMIEFLHTLSFNSVTMVTLTYPRDYPVDWHEYKKQLRAFRARLERRYGRLKIVWRLEYQKRGAPHYHLLILDPPFLCIPCVCRAWHQVIKSNDVNHLKIGVDVKRVTDYGDRGLVAWYVSKYVAKTTGEVEEYDRGKTGRHWGYWNIEKEAPIEITLEDREAEHVSIVLFSSRGRADTWRPTDYTSCTIMGDSVGSNKFMLRAIATLASGQKER